MRNCNFYIDSYMKKAPLFFLFLFALAAYGQQGQSFLDSRDGKKYKTVKIGNQTWMAENLNYDAKSSKCYDNKPENCTKYGRLYNWETAMKACPPGWHLPNESEYEMLNEAVGGEEVAGKKLKAKSGWNHGGNGTDEYGFSALPGGDGNLDGSFYDVGGSGLWWSAREYYDSNVVYYRIIHYRSEGAYWSNGSKSLLRSVRCLLTF